MSLTSFYQWKLNEGKKGKKGKTYTTTEPRKRDTEILSSGKSIKIDTQECSPERMSGGRPASACYIKGDEKKYNRRKFKSFDH